MHSPSGNDMQSSIGYRSMEADGRSPMLTSKASRSAEVSDSIDRGFAGENNSSCEISLVRRGSSQVGNTKNAFDNNGTAACEVANELEPNQLPASTMKAEQDRQDSTLTPRPVRTLLDTVRDDYDVVLFDTPPILASAEAEMLIQAPSGAILIVASGLDVPRDVKTATRRLERIAPPVVGTVITYESSSKEKYDRSAFAIVKRWLEAA
jgi:hypothetical protein